MTYREREILILLQDYMNILPAGPQEAYVPYGSATTSDGWPLNAESIRRMESPAVRDTYDVLNAALSQLAREHPLHYNILLMVYLQPDKGHSDMAHIRKSTPVLGKLHDSAIQYLAQYIGEATHLEVNWPSKASGSKTYASMEEKHTELYNIFLRYREQGIEFEDAVKNAADYLGYADYNWVKKLIRRRLTNA